MKKSSWGSIFAAHRCFIKFYHFQALPLTTHLASSWMLIATSFVHTGCRGAAMIRHRLGERRPVFGPVGRYGAIRLAEVQCVVRNWYRRHLKLFIFLNHRLLFGFRFHWRVPGAEVWPRQLAAQLVRRQVDRRTGQERWKTVASVPAGQCPKVRERPMIYIQMVNLINLHICSG